MRKKRKLDKSFKAKELKKQQAMNEDYKRALNFIIVLIVIIGLLALLFYLNGKFVSKDMFQDPTTTTTTEPVFVESTILADDIFKIKDKEYMVLLYDTKDKTEEGLYGSALQYYSSDKVKLYFVDLGNKMNKKHFKEDGKENKKPTKASDVVVTRSTLMVINKGKVKEYITDAKEILKKLTKDED